MPDILQYTRHASLLIGLLLYTGDYPRSHKIRRASIINQGHVATQSCRALSLTDKDFDKNVRDLA